MRIKVTNPILDLEGKAIKSEGSDATFRIVFYNALNQFLPEEKPTSEEKAKCFGLMQKIFKSDEVNITSDEAALLKERVGKLYNPLVFGRVSELLDGPAATEASE